MVARLICSEDVEKITSDKWIRTPVQQLRRERCKQEWEAKLVFSVSNDFDAMLARNHQHPALS
jgi:hypothetical protein